MGAALASGAKAVTNRANRRWRRRLPESVSRRGRPARPRLVRVRCGRSPARPPKEVVAAARAASGSRLAGDADVVVATAVAGAADADEQHECAGRAGADGGRVPVEALVDGLYDGRGFGLDDDRLAAVLDRRVGHGPRARGGGGERPGDEGDGGEAGDAVRVLHDGLLPRRFGGGGW